MFTVGCVQFNPVRRNVTHNIARLDALLHDVRADLLVLPELANSGYLYPTPAGLTPYAESADGSGPFLSALQQFAVHTGGMIVAGFAERAGAGLYNSAAAVTAAGVVQVYRKTHLFWDEKSLFLPGDTGFHLCEHQGARIGMMICFDWYFPESARTLALLGAQIVAHPSNLVLPHCQTAMVTRCLENRVYAITTNRYGAKTLDGNSLVFTGASPGADPPGRAAAAGAHSRRCGPADGD